MNKTLFLIGLLILFFIIFSFIIVFPNPIVIFTISVSGLFALFIRKRVIAGLVILSYIILIFIELALGISFIEYNLLQLFLVILFYNVLDFIDDYGKILDKQSLKYIYGYLYSLSLIFIFSFLSCLLFLNLGIFLGVPNVKVQYILLYLIIFLVFLALIVKNRE